MLRRSVSANLSSTMKIYFHASTAQRAQYTHKILRYFFSRYGGTVLDTPDGADLIGASICSVRELSAVIAARKIATMHHVPLLIGGPETYIGDPLLAWADHLCIGEGYRLLSTLAQRGISAIADAPNVLSRGSSTTISPDYTIPWKEIPAIQTAPRAYYYLHGRGCHRKCKFCFTSWT